MFRVIFEAVVYLLAVYGLLFLAAGIAGSVKQRLNGDSSRVRMVLLIKNQESTIEGIIRNIFSGDMLRRVMSGEKLTVVDMGSTDKTLDILKKLRENYRSFDIVEENEKSSIFTSYDDV